MIANLQKILALALVISAIGWGSYFGTHHSPYVGMVGMAAILFSYALFLAMQFAALAIVDRPVAWKRHAWKLFNAWLGEVSTSPRVFFWWQPFRSDAIPDLLLPEKSGQRGVVLVHGLACNRGFWNPWLKELHFRRIPFVALNLEPPFSSIDDYDKIIDKAVRRLYEITNRKPLVVAHSMGGLAVRAWLNRCADAQSNVHHIVTIGTPHAGTWLARYSRSSNGIQMRIDSVWLKKLREREPDTIYRRFTCFYSDCDNVVFPVRNATLSDADNRCIEGSAHVRMAYEPRVYAEVLRLLARP
jgi:pimeloyl-ACP methyl ester carboxylesterase